MNLLTPSRTTLISVRNVEAALPEALKILRDNHRTEKTRNGPCAVFPGPVVTEYFAPWERVLFNPDRNANPFFHFMESLWMLAGLRSVRFLKHFNKRISDYSDDGVTFNGAYGHRWRKYFGYDQLQEIVDLLRHETDTRRAVLGMWDAGLDLVDSRKSKDIPCNTQVYFDCRNGVLNMTVTNRSNDLFWGAYGANAVHFSMLQQYLAEWLGVNMGVYTQFSNNMHVYLEKYPYDKWDEIIDGYRPHYIEKSMLISSEKSMLNSPDSKSMLFPTPLGGSTGAAGLRAIRKWVENYDKNKSCDSGMPLLDSTADQMLMAWNSRNINLPYALGWAERIEAPDWRTACIEWLFRYDATRKARGAV